MGNNPGIYTEMDIVSCAVEEAAIVRDLRVLCKECGSFSSRTHSILTQDSKGAVDNYQDKERQESGPITVSGQPSETTSKQVWACVTSLFLHTPSAFP